MEEVSVTAISPEIRSVARRHRLGEGQSGEAIELKIEQNRAFAGFQRSRAWPPHLRVLSPLAQVAVDAQWSDVCEAMFEFLSINHPADLLALVSSNVLAPPALTFAAEIAGGIEDGAAVRGTLLPLLDHTSPLVREGAAYGLATHLDEGTIERLEALAKSDLSPGVRQAVAEVLTHL